MAEESLENHVLVAKCFHENLTYTLPISDTSLIIASRHIMLNYDKWFVTCSANLVHCFQ